MYVHRHVYIFSFSHLKLMNLLRQCIICWLAVLISLVSDSQRSFCFCLPNCVPPWLQELHFESKQILNSAVFSESSSVESYVKSSQSRWQRVQLLRGTRNIFTLTLCFLYYDFLNMFLDLVFKLFVCTCVCVWYVHMSVTPKAPWSWSSEPPHVGIGDQTLPSVSS